MNIMRWFYVGVAAFIGLGFAFALSGCSTPAPITITPPSISTTAPAPSVANDPLSNLNAFTLADLQQAESIATAQGDTIAQACYPALMQFVTNLPHGSTAKPVGAFSVFQTARGTRLALTGGVPVALKLACSPLLMDEQQFLLKLGVIASGAAITGGALPLLPIPPPVPLS